MSRADGFDFTLDEETEKRLYDLMTDMDTRRTNRFWIKDKRGYHAEYVKIIHCKDCKFSSPNQVYGCRINSFANDLDKRMYSDDFCSRAERREE